MVEISIRFVGGRFHATPWGRHPREGEPEWPPSPWRLLRALASSYHRAGGEENQNDVLALLQLLAQPVEFCLPAAAASHTRHYLPQGDPRDKQLVFDAFVAISTDTDVTIRWPDLMLKVEQKELLDRLLGRLSYFGRAESWAELRLGGASSTANCNLRESQDSEAVRVLCADPEVTWAQLNVETPALQKQGWSDPPGSCWKTYYRSSDCFTKRSLRAGRKGGGVARAVRFGYTSRVLPRRALSLYVAETVRTDLLSIAGTEIRDGLQGKHQEVDGSFTPLPGHLHPYILALPANGTRQYLVSEVLVYKRDGFNPGEMDALLRLPAQQQRRHRVHQFDYIESLNAEHLLQIPCARLSSEWHSRTPYVQTRHIKRGPSGSLLEQVRLELLNHGHREASELLLAVEKHDAKEIEGIPLPEFRTQRKDRPRPRYGVHSLILRFSAPVNGPLTLGYGAHFGLGQFWPI